MTFATVLNDAGRTITTGLLSGASSLKPNYLGVGSGGAVRTPVHGDSALTTELTTGSTRASGALTQVTTTTASDTIQVVGNVTASGSWVVNEAALFDAVTAGNMFMETTFANIALSSGDSIQCTLKLQVV